MLCLDNFVIEFDRKFYTREKGIITGENNSVTLANIGLHYIITRTESIKQTILFKRFIDDIMYITEENNNEQTVKNELINNFKKYELKLTFREVTTEQENEEVEFLDVNHKITPKGNKGFITTNFIKPTAVNSTFLHGRSYHPHYMFKSIIYSEAIRLRRLNEMDSDYIKSIKQLEIKCKKSHFNENTIKENIKNVINWKQVNEGKTEQNKENTKQQKERNTWITKFKSLLKLSPKEKELSPNTCITYKRPCTLQGLLTNYKKISRGIEIKQNGLSSRCGKCSLCGGLEKFKNKNMVNETNKTTTKDGKIIWIKEQLNCRNYGIYEANCRICMKSYVGQTKTTFTKR